MHPTHSINLQCYSSMKSHIFTKFKLPHFIFWYMHGSCSFLYFLVLGWASFVSSQRMQRHPLYVYICMYNVGNPPGRSAQGIYHICRYTVHCSKLHACMHPVYGLHYPGDKKPDEDNKHHIETKIFIPKKRTLQDACCSLLHTLQIASRCQLHFRGEFVDIFHVLHLYTRESHDQIHLPQVPVKLLENWQHKMSC